MINKPKVSIIVPVYNVENYLDRCLNSLINQSIKDIEIIAINDGSTDCSLQILDKYKDKDRRVIVIDNINKGVSHCRNIGIKNSTGEYIMFVDSDDWIDKNMAEIMYKEAVEKKLDLVMCNYVREFANHSKEKIFNLPYTTIYKKEEIKSNLQRKLMGPIGNEISDPADLDALGTVWGKLYKTEVIQDNKLEFVDLSIIGSAEDTLFNLYAFNHINTAVFLNKPMYHYWRDNPKSITSKYNPKLKEQRKSLFKYMRDFIEKNNLEPIFNKALNNRICISVLGLGLMECCKDNKISYIAKIKNMKYILKQQYIEEAYKELDLKRFPVYWRLFYFFNKYKLAVGSYVMVATIAWLRTKI